MVQRAPRSRRVSAPRIRPWTRADLARLPDDGNRYEVLDGVLLVTPQARFAHQRVAWRLGMPLTAYCEAHRIGGVVGPGAVPHGKSELQPDVQVILGRIPPDSDWTELPIPALVVEVLSDSTCRRDLGIKLDAYLKWGVPEYWAVDAEAHVVHVFTPATPEGTIVTDALRWRPREDVPAFTLSLAALFADTAAAAQSER